MATNAGLVVCVNPPGSKRKGSTAERKFGSVLSQWISVGARTDLFARTVLSGGQFTGAKGERGIPGDLMANSPLAFAFMGLFAIECKHHKDIGLDKYILDSVGSTFLAKTYAKTLKDAARHGLHPFVMAKSNNYPSIVLMEHDVGMVALKCSDKLRYHRLHNDSVFACTLGCLILNVPAEAFIVGVKNMHKPDGV